MIRSILLGAITGLSTLAAVALPASASELLSGPQILERVAGNTLEGRRLDTGAFIEYYSLEGQVLAQNYEKAWHVEGDKLCFQHASFRSGERDLGDCYRLSLVGDELQWLDPDGKFDGHAQVLPGNTFGY